MGGDHQPASQEPDRGQTPEFQNFASALETIMSVRKDDLDPGPVRQPEKSTAHRLLLVAVQALAERHLRGG